MASLPPRLRVPFFGAGRWTAAITAEHTYTNSRRVHARTDIKYRSRTSEMYVNTRGDQCMYPMNLGCAREVGRSRLTCGVREHAFLTIAAEPGLRRAIRMLFHRLDCAGCRSHQRACNICSSLWPARVSAAQYEMVSPKTPIGIPPSPAYSSKKGWLLCRPYTCLRTQHNTAVVSYRRAKSRNISEKQPPEVVSPHA